MKPNTNICAHFRTPTVFTSTVLFLLLMASIASDVCAQSWSYRPTVFANGFVQTVNNQAQAATYLGFASLTNNNTWTGTNTFPAAKFYPANSIGMRLLWSSPTNIPITSINAAAIGSVTNNDGFAVCTPLVTLTLPALLGSNSVVAFVRTTETPFANTTAGSYAFYVGPSTNFIGTFVNGIAATATRGGSMGSPLDILSNAESFTSNAQGINVSNPLILGSSNFVNTASDFVLRVGLFTTTSCTNINVRHFSIYELYAP